MLNQVKHARHSREHIPGRQAFWHAKGKLDVNYVPRRRYRAVGYTAAGMVFQEWTFQQENNQGARMAVCHWMRHRPQVDYTLLSEVLDTGGTRSQRHVDTVRSSDL